MQVYSGYLTVVKVQYYLMLGLIVALLATGCGSPRPTATETLPATQLPLPTLPPAPTPLPQPTETPAPRISAVCTPLADHRIADLLLLYLTQPFIPPQGANRETGHHGLDFAYYHGGPTGGHIDGTVIESVLDAQVAGLGFNAVYGYYLVTETPAQQLPAQLIELYEMQPDQSLYVLYGHMQADAPFALGQPVGCGEFVGRVGDSGSRLFLTDPHLHIETRVGLSGQQLSEMDYYVAEASEAQQAEYIRWRTSDDFRLADPTYLLEYQP